MMHVIFEIQMYTIDCVYSGGSNTEQVRYSDGP